MSKCKAKLQELWSQLWGHWDQFWFHCDQTYSLGVFRFLVASAMFAMYSIRFAGWEKFFSESALIGPDIALETIWANVRPWITWFPVDNEIIVLLQILYLVTLLLLALGLWSRPMALLAWGLHAAFLQRNYAAIYGIDMLITSVLLYLALTKSDQSFSLKNVLCKKENKKEGVDLLTSVGIRILQIQFCIVYVYAGIEKIRGNSWWEGTAIWRVFANPQMTTADFTFFRYTPWIMPLLTYGTLIFELYFPFLIYSKKFRYPAMIVGLGFHLGITVVMGLPFFSFCMMSSYLLFISSETVRNFVERMRSYWRKKDD